MTTFDKIKNVAELLSFISTPVLAFFAWRMLAQLKIGGEQVKVAAEQISTSKKISEIQAKRESMKIAAEQSVFYAEKIIPQMDKFLKLKKEKKYPVLSRAKVTENWPHIQCETDNIQGLISEVESHNGLVVKTLNQLEGLAIFFVCGVADAESAYRPLCSSYCRYIRNFLPYIIIANEQHNQFSNVLRLYGAWAMRDQAEKSFKEIQKHKEHLSRIKVPEMNPFGTEKNC